MRLRHADQFLLGLDVGTSSVKCVAASLNGTRLWTADVRYEFDVPHPGWAEQDPDVWWQASTQAVRKLLSEHPEVRDGVSAIGVCGQGVAAVLLDRYLHPVRPAILWLDSRSAPEAQSLNEACGSEIAWTSGKSPAAYNVEPKLLWVKSHEPGVWNKTRWCVTTTAYVTYRLCGELVMNHSDAGILLSYNLRERCWSRPLMARMGLSPELYWRLQECDEIAGVLTQEVAVEMGLRAGIPVIAGGEDTSAAAFAAGAISPKLGILSLGTAGTIYIPCDRPVTHPQLLSFPHVLNSLTLVGGSTVCGGSGLDWIVRLLGKSDLCQEASAAISVDNRLVFLPYLSGELQPINDGFARGVFFGLSFSTSAQDLVAAVIEGTAFAFRHNLEVVNQLRCHPESLVATGRPAQSSAFIQTVSDVTDLPIRILASSGGAALGAAMLCSKVVGISVDELVNRYTAVTNEVAPRSERQERLSDLFAIYKEIYSRLQDLFPRLQPQTQSYRCAEVC